MDSYLKKLSFSSSSLSYNSSFGSSSSFSSNPTDSPLSPLDSCRLSQIPFSWEQHPGVPKTSSHIEDVSTYVLPLPPTRKKPVDDRRLKRDPFVAAMLKCSNEYCTNEGVEEYWKSNKVVSWRSFSDRIGFIDFYTSCKRTCDVAESNVLLPRRRSRRNKELGSVKQHMLLKKRSTSNI
ncbi:hypothetical protein GIB67_026270 [Kingdonia uniflora]|uniref:Uncharacterized protein n=1 Tax=Kingdonia uniflora TaxID=39325 RepID=A0A7J7LA49_9MAGN|nr:hypothetical protein GIB67_026270 [Kingdonia uniflora]